MHFSNVLVKSNVHLESSITEGVCLCVALSSMHKSGGVEEGRTVRNIIQEEMSGGDEDGVRNLENAGEGTYKSTLPYFGDSR